MFSSVLERFHKSGTRRSKDGFQANNSKDGVAGTESGVESEGDAGGSCL